MVIPRRNLCLSTTHISHHNLANNVSSFNRNFISRKSPAFTSLETPHKITFHYQQKHGDK